MVDLIDFKTVTNVRSNVYDNRKRTVEAHLTVKLPYSIKALVI